MDIVASHSHSTPFGVRRVIACLPEVPFGHLRLTFFPCWDAPILQDTRENKRPLLTAHHFDSANPDSERFPETPVEVTKTDMFRVDGRGRWSYFSAKVPTGVLRSKVFVMNVCSLRSGRPQSSVVLGSVIRCAGRGGIFNSA